MIRYASVKIGFIRSGSLSTHSAGAIYDAFPSSEARRVIKRLEFHYTPRHASWLNMVEIEIGVLRSQCLDRRIEDNATLVAEVAAWEQRRNNESRQDRMALHHREGPRKTPTRLPRQGVS